MKAARLHKIGDIRCEEVETPIPRGEELLLKVGACGICGSDLPRVFEHGSSNGKYPLTIGHEFSGEVVAVGEKADASLIGVRAAIYPLIPCGKCDPCVTGHYAMCENYDYLGSRRDGGFAEYCLVPSAWHLIFSKKATMEELAMTEPACVAQHAVRRANVTAGQFAVIFGAGPIGMMAARWVKIFGAEPLLVDIAEEKVEFAARKGFQTIHSEKTDVVEEVRKRAGGKLADAAIEGTGTSAALINCVACLRAHGTVAMLGNPVGDTTLPLKVHSMLLRKEITLNGIWNQSRSPYPVNEWEYAVRLMDQGKLTVSDLITDRLSLEELPTALEEIKTRKRKVVKAIYSPAK